MKDKKPKKPRDEILDEYIKNAPAIGGFTIEELSEITKTHSHERCPTCGRPYNDNIKY